MSNQVSVRHIAVEERGDVTVVTITEEKVLNDNVIEGIKRELNALLEEENRKRFIIDFERIEFLSSLMLGRFMAFERMIKARGGRLILCGMSPEVFELFMLTNLTKVFVVRDSMDQALAEMA